MKKLLTLLAVSVGFSSAGFSTVANATSFVCHLDSNPKVVVSGTISNTVASIKIRDEDERLGIRDLNPKSTIEMPRLERKREANYTFAKYYSDFNAWQDIDIAIPKAINSKFFKSFLTVYGDNGDAMVPGVANKMSCVVVIL